MPKTSPTKAAYNARRDRSGKLAAKRLAILAVYDREVELQPRGAVQAAADSCGVAWRTVKAAIAWRNQQLGEKS